MLCRLILKVMVAAKIIFIALLAIMVIGIACFADAMFVQMTSEEKEKESSKLSDLEMELMSMGYSKVNECVPVEEDMKGHPTIYKYAKDINYKYEIMFGTNGSLATPFDDITVEIRYFGYGSESFCAKDVQFEDPAHGIQAIEDHARDEYENRVKHQKRKNI